ncbi:MULTISPECIES: glutathione peroxidase [unclassified Microbulbifer]|uniref:Glutathione peroxidase n=1 Tax=Microbulbifer spongiae TaxID=2944933 RepID=A0ABY9ECK2_9GAMM|nr:MULTISPECIES: glutathione peroxidase [unclassified Microbulbifer]MDP5209440.1 glutathione peroxidase [Microbulbifer sp. 2205BS26-8]WKD49244.1 glutathione peroxidase [Microbulbifer sp. MI-G]
MADLYSIPIETADGKASSLEAYKGKLLLVVNTASQCGFTKQYKGLEALYNSYKARGLVVLGFPCNQFGNQEPGSNEEIQTFCTLNFGVSFPVYAKLDVNGPAAHPLFVELKRRAPGLLGTEGIKWNFTKFLISRDGKAVKRFAPKDTPESLQAEIEQML